MADSTRGRFLPFRLPESWSGRVLDLSPMGLQQGATEMAEKKAPHDGEYTIDGSYFWIAEGDPLPDGAEAVEAEWAATDQIVETDEGVDVPAVYVQSTPVEFDADQLASLGLVADPDKLKDAIDNGEFGSLVAVWVKTSTEPFEGFGPLGKVTGTADGDEENISLASGVESDEETPVIDPADLKPVEEAVAEPVAKPKRGGKAKAAPETPEGAGPVIETPEDGSDEAETPEGATE